jgi:hypothetical protein
VTVHRNADSVFPLVATSIAIGIADDSVFFFFPILLSRTGFAWMLAALLLWTALLGFGFHRLRVRALWLLLGLPLVFLPFVAAVIAAGQI